MTITDLELARLLSTRLCHDLAGPVGAVSAGVELIGDDPSQVDEETLALIGDSSAAASRKLRFLRAALGVANGSAHDVEGLLEGYLGAMAGMGGKVAVSWPTPAAVSAAESALGPALNQILLNLCLFALESQPGCRTLSLSLNVEGSSLAISVEVTGSPDRAPILRDDMIKALNGESEPPVSAKTVQAYVAGRLVRSLSGTVGCAAGESGVDVSAVFPGSVS